VLRQDERSDNPRFSIIQCIASCGKNSKRGHVIRYKNPERQVE